MIKNHHLVALFPLSNKVVVKCDIKAGSCVGYINLFADVPEVETWVHIGGRNIMSGSLCAPLKCGYGIYDVGENTFYDLDDLAKDYSKYNGLMETLEAFEIGNLTGDANLDNTVSISDVTCIQRRVVELHQFNSYQNE